MENGQVRASTSKTNSINKLYQIRYFGKANTKEINVSDETKTNNIEYVDLSQNLINGSVKKIGIQTIPGIRFFVDENSEYPIIIGMSGIFELDLTLSTATINHLRFDVDSLDIIENNPGGYLIIDLLYVN